MLARTDRPFSRSIARPVGRRLPGRGYLAVGFVGWGLVLRRVLETLV